jgi:hypothetical protein
MRRVCSILALLLLAGCATQPTAAQLRVSEPLHKATFPKDYQALASCIVHAIAGKYPVSKRVDQAAGKASVSSEVQTRQGPAMPLWLVTIDRVDAGHSHAEIIAVIQGDESLLPDDVWPAVETCGKAA